MATSARPEYLPALDSGVFEFSGRCFEQGEVFDMNTSSSNFQLQLGWKPVFRGR